MTWIFLLLVTTICVAAYTWVLLLDGRQRETLQALVDADRARRVGDAVATGRKDAGESAPWIPLRHLARILRPIFRGRPAGTNGGHGTGG